MASVSSNRADDTRRAILAAARSSFAARGFAGSSTRAIAGRAGVTQPLIHHYFGTKDALFTGVLEEALAEYEAVQSEQWAMAPGDPRFLTRGLLVLFRWLGRNLELARLISWARLEGRSIHMEGFAQIYDRVRTQLDAARDAQLVRPDIDTDAVILMIDSLFKGYWDRRESYLEGPAALDDLDRRMERTAVESVIRGLATASSCPKLLALLDSPDPQR